MSKKKIYTVATAHLDTIWSWDFETTVSRYIYNTLVDNFALFKKYPTYTFSFEGSYRYELMEEYYPELFEQMKEYIKQGRWNVAGSSYENGDVNMPSPEALFRNILFGNSYFGEKFGKRSLDIYLPDCFGFGWALPSIANHANLCGFTTQKLAWGSAYGIPFDIGKWYGVDGNFIYASVNPHDYYFTFKKLRDWDFVLNKFKENEKYGLDWTYMFHGTGDRGGAPDESTIKFVEDEIAKNNSSDIEVVSASADQIYRDIKSELSPEVESKLPQWKTELVMQNHGVGGYTSRAIGKRWNNRCQELADMAERAGVVASHFNTADYNEAVLEKSWKRAIAHQFHDDTPGTSVQRAYKRSWNDYAMSINQFTGELESSLASITPLMKSDFCTGIPIMVSNSIESKRIGAVKIRLKDINEPYIRIFNDKGKEVKSQLLNDKDGVKEVLFIAEVDSLGLRVYDARPSKEPCKVKSKLKITDTVIENQKYVVEINRRGNICSIIDKTDDERELLSAPIVLGMFNYTGSKDWPAWEMNYDEANKEPDRIPDIVSVKKVETGPARVAFEIKQTDKKSEFNTYISLADGGEYVEVYNEIEWQSMRTMCKNRFAFTAENEKATFDLGLGAIERENMNEKLFEVPAQKWADITDKSGEFGVSVLSDCKQGWDKYNNNTLRLTAIHTPKRNYRIDSMQSMLDLGLNRYSYAIYSHKGAVGVDTQLAAREFTAPMTAVAFEKHQGVLKSSYSFGSVSSNDVIIRAIKKPHHKLSDEIIVRLNEGSNKSIDRFELILGEGIESAKELYASEEYKADAVIENGKLVTSFDPYEIKTFSLKLKPSSVKTQKFDTKDVKLDYNDCIIISQNEKRSVKGSSNFYKFAVPREIIADKINVFSAEFSISQSTNNAVFNKQITVPVSENATQLKFLCGAVDGDKKVNFIVDGEKVEKTVNDTLQEFAHWDLYDLNESAYIKTGHLGFEATHCHDENGKDVYAKGMYFWVVTIDVSGKKEVIVEKNDSLVVLSACELFAPRASLITPLADEVKNNRPITFKKNLKEWIWYLHSKCVWMIHDRDNFLSHNNNGKKGKRIEQTGNRAVTKNPQIKGD